MKKKFTFIDLFAGIGGFHQAMKSLGGKCVFASAFEPHAAETYRENYKDTPLFGDITKQEVKDHVPQDFDIFCGGSPCQGFSIAT